MDTPQRKIPVKDIAKKTKSSTQGERGEDFHRSTRSYSTELEGIQRTHRRRKRSGTLDSERVFGSKTRLTRIPWYGFLCVGLLAAGLFFTTIFYYKSRVGVASKQHKSASIATRVDPTMVEVTTKWSGLQPKPLAERFLAAKTVDERLLLVSDPKEVAGIMHNFYEVGPGKYEELDQLLGMTQDLASANTVARFTVKFKDLGQRLLYIPYETSGNAKVDFKCYARYCSESWTDLLSGKVSKASEMRCILKVSDYYNQEFGSETEWLALIATSPDFEDVLYFYVKRDDPNFATFVANPPTKPVRYTIALEGRGPSYLRRQFQVSQILHSGWLGH